MNTSYKVLCSYHCITSRDVSYLVVPLLGVQGLIGRFRCYQPDSLIIKFDTFFKCLALSIADIVKS